ncbi:EamA family transporter RarD [Halarcobacter bivalviorum]|uniref:Protein RarD n=1 Tax=Halarcobacter bivalviorum TaxID=663364 RepID=A0AAX2A7X0_9BACT|nr:EamA family transporter RarD [Halarcobacter bivalviorum]AXH13368.1 resistance permease RarD [Halarcobacter bivalviorum]RXK10029.1 protein RarD [Halarcobacter bivalviorum]
MSESRLGQIYAILAFLFWGGIAPIYFKQVANVDAFEVLIYRVLFSCLTLLPFFLFRKELQALIVAIKDFRTIKYLFFSTFVISINWLTFIWAIANDRILEASLGYYINPLVNVGLGFLIFNERMTRNQYLAIFIGLLAVAYQLFALGYLPLVSLILAFSFGFYGMLRKKVNVGSIVGLFIEVIILLPFALAYLFYLYQYEVVAFFESSSFYTSFMLALSGLVTVIPLLLFNGATTRMKLTTIGFFQYIGPTVAFFVAIFIYKEEFNFDKLVTFILIWIALFVFSLGTINKLRKGVNR